jgi:hypothetical protein
VNSPSIELAHPALTQQMATIMAIEATAISVPVPTEPERAETGSVPLRRAGLGNETCRFFDVER